MTSESSEAVNKDAAARLPALGVSRRWVIVAMLFAASVLNYVDRQTLSILAPTVQKELAMSDLDYAHIVQMFLVAYTLAYLFVGRITDWLGTRLSLALFVTWWSVANMLTGFVQSISQFGVTRFLLGLGEAGNYTAAPKAVSEWLPTHERALGVGIYTAGAMVGATISPPLIGWLGLRYGWRAAFVATGALGFIWLVAWLLLNKRPADVAGSDSAISDHGVTPSRGSLPWRTILTQRSVWTLIFARMLTDPVWYFYLFWFPKYLSDDRGLVLLQLAQIGWIVYLAADFGSVLGGIASGRLVRSGASAVSSRLTIMRWAAAIVPAGAIIALQPSLELTLLLAALVAFCHLAWQVNVTSLVVDLYPSHQVGSIFGAVAAGSAFGGILSTQAIGYLVTEHSYASVFLLMSVLHPLALLVTFTLRRRGAE